MKSFVEQSIRHGISFFNTTASVKTLIIITLAFILSSREMYVALDDHNYLAYFSGGNIEGFFGDSWWSTVIDEPLWKGYTNLLGAILEPEIALRVTIFFSVYAFLFALNRFSPEAFGFFIFSFLICHELAVQLYFNQLRQGFAISLGLLVLSLANTSLLRMGGILGAALIHTSMLTVLPVLFIIQWVKRGSYRLIFVCFAVGFIFLMMRDGLQNIDLGRRSDDYDFAGVLNLNFYIFTAIKYVPIFVLIALSRADGWRNYWYCFSLIYFFIAIGMTFLSEAGGRLTYMSTVFVIILISTNWKFKYGKIVAIYFLAVSLFFSILEGTKLSDYDAWSGRWSLILGG